MMNHLDKKSLTLHKKLQGKITTEPKHSLEKLEDWNLLYTPGVGTVAQYVAQHPEQAREYTIKKNTVAIISDGSAVLGLGNIGPLGALPVMEGKCAILKAVANINAFPIVLNTQDPKQVIETIKNIAPTFGGINLEDFSAPHCFEIEETLKKELNIPVMHDDQHGTAIVVLSGIINALKVVKKKKENIQIVIVGAGAAGTAIAKLLVLYGIKNVIITDSTGIIHKKRAGISGYKQELANITNPKQITGTVADAVAGADVIIGVSGPNTITTEHIAKMNTQPIVFALANPIPEIMPSEAKKAGAYIIATGRSDFNNQINNALAFPGIFKGALKNNVQKITDEMKIKAAEKIASLIKKPTPDCIIPPVTTKGLADAVAKVIK